MNRREFINSALALTASLGLDPLTAIDGEAQDTPLPIDSDNPLSLSINGLFMQDYASGEAWAPSQPAVSWIELYTAGNGSPQIYTTTTPGMAPGGETSTLSQLTRIYQGARSLTGWGKQVINLPRDTISLTGNGPADPTPLLSSMVFLPGSSPKLFLFRNYRIDHSDLGPDGSMGPVPNTLHAPFGGPGRLRDLFAVKSLSYPLVTGELPLNSHYVPEVFVSDMRPTSVALRSLPDYDLVHIYDEPGKPAFPLEAQAPTQQRKQRVFPLKGTGADLYRCISLEPDGTVRSLLLTKNQSAPWVGWFVVKEQQALGQCTNGCIHVHEGTAGEVDIVLFDLPGIRTIRGQYDPAQSLPTVWQPVAHETLTGFRFPYASTAAIEMVGAYHEQDHLMDIFLMVRNAPTDPTCDVWTSTRCHNDAWRQLVCVERGCFNASVFPSRGSVKLLVQRNTSASNAELKPQYEFWDRSPQGFWAIDVASLPREGAPVAIPSYRVGVKFSQNSLGLPGERLGVSASVLSLAEVNGRRTVIPADAQFQATTDHTGTLWITLPMKQQLNFPDLTITSRRFSQKLFLPLSEAIASYLLNVTGSDLSTRTAHGSTLIADPATANNVARAIQSLIQAGRRPVPGTTVPPQDVVVNAGIQYSWIGTGTSSVAPAPPTGLAGTVLFGGGASPVPSPSPAWQMNGSGGGFQSISVHAAQSLIVEQIQNYVFTSIPRPGSSSGGRSIPNQNRRLYSFSDFLDDVEDGAEWIGGRIEDLVTIVGQAAVDLTKVVMDGAVMTINMTVKGIEYVYSGVVDAIHKAMDAVRVILDYAGVAQGMITNWLLEQLGFLFDWDAITSKRTELKNLVKNNTSKLTSWIPDPTTAANSVLSRLDSLESQLQSYKSRRGSSTPISSRFRLTGGLPELADVGGAIGLPKINTLLDKFQSGFFDIDVDFGIPNIPGMQPAVDSMMPKISEAMDFLPSMFTSFTQSAEDWISNDDSFVGSTASAFMDILIDQATRLIRLIRDLIALAADAVTALKAAPGAIIAWLDTTLDIPYYSSFYYGLTGSNLSFFDLACLAAAICADPDPGQSSAPSYGSNRSVNRVDTEAGQAAHYFMYAGNIANALASFIGAESPGTVFSNATSALYISCMAGTLICTLIEEGDYWIDVAAAAGGVIAVFMYGLYRNVVVVAALGLFLAVRIALIIYEAIQQSGSAIAYNLVGLFQLFLSFIVNLYTTQWTRTDNGLNITRRPLDPERAAIHAAIQYMLGAIGYNIYIGQPLISVTP